MKESYNKSIERSLKLVSEYLSSLNVISFEKIVELLKEENTKYHISFTNSYDILNDKYYSCVVVHNRLLQSIDRAKYLAPCDNDLDIYQGMIAEILKQVEEPRFQIFDNDFTSCRKDLICGVEDNLLVFPPNLLKILMTNAVSEDNKRENDIACKYKNQMLYIPSNLRNNSEEKQNVFQRILKKISR